MAEDYNKEAVRAILTASIAKAGSASAWGRQHGISSAYVAEVRDAIKPASDRVLAPLGLVRRIEIVPIEEPRS